MLPLQERPLLNQLLNDPKGITILVESARAIARDAQVAEEAWKKSKESGVEIVASDLPTLFKHYPTPGEALIRKVMFAVFEFERDLVVARMADGLAQKKARLTPSPSTITQQGSLKVNGRKSRLQMASPSGRQCLQMDGAVKKYQLGRITLDGVCESFRRVLSARTRKPVAPITKETCRRMMTELQSRRSWKF